MQSKVSPEEYAVLAVAAAKSGLTVTGYVASSAVAVARGEVTPLPASTGDAVRELVAARTQLRRYGVLLNQAVAKLNATGAADAALEAALAQVRRRHAGGHRRGDPAGAALMTAAPLPRPALTVRHECWGWRVIGRVYRGSDVGGLVRYL